jgi:hypothetical protein
MENKHQVHNLIILDESGSMESIKENILQGLNEIIQTIKGIENQFPDQEHFISFITFNGLGKKVLHFMEPVSKLNVLNAASYNPDASTPLFDAMGTYILKLKNKLEKVEKYNVLVSILTDGEENASVEYSGLAIRALVEELKEKTWTFTYMGTEHDVERMATSISITNTIKFSKQRESMDAMFEKEKFARRMYSDKIRKNESVKDNFYEDEESDNKKSHTEK